MKSIFITAGPLGAWDFQPHLGLAYLCSYLEHHGYDHVRYFDTSAEPLSRLKEYFEKESPDIIGVNMYTPTRWDSMKVVRMAKAMLPNCKVLVGGVHPTFLPEQMIQNYPEIDYVVFGEGEETTLELVRTIEKKGDPSQVAGVCFRNEKGEAVKNCGRHSMVDLDTLPFPRYMAHYAWLDGKKVKAGSMITSRGCAAACNFCTVPAFWGRQRLRSPESVIREMEWLVNEHGVEYIWFMDDTFTIEMDEARELLNSIIASGLNKKVRWRCATRVNCVNRELLGLMREAGCHRVSYGVESGSPDILKTVMKGTRLEQAEQACLLTKEMGMLVETNFMVGNPGETQETINHTKAFIKKVQPNEFNVSNALYLFPGTPSYSMAKRQGFISDDIWLTDVQTVAYTAEHPQSQLSCWQLEIIRECGRWIGFWNTLRYMYLILKGIPLRRLLNSFFSLFASVVKRIFSFGRRQEEVRPAVDLEKVRLILREESIKARKPDQLKPLKAVKRLKGMSLERFSG